MSLDYYQLKQDFKRILSQVNEEEVKKWLEEDEKRLEEVPRRNGKTERLLQIALDKLLEEKVISIGKEICEYGAPRRYATFVDSAPKDFERRLLKLCKQLGLNVKTDAYHNIYLMDKQLVENLNISLLKDENFKHKEYLEFFEYTQTLDYLHKYISSIDINRTPFMYVEYGIPLKVHNLEYIKIVK